MSQNNIPNLKGVVVPLGSLYTKNNPVIGEFADLIPFAQFCKNAGFGIIQLLPLNDSGTQSSPYSALSAFALHPIYIRIPDIPGFENLYNTNQEFKKNWNNFVNAHGYVLRYNYDEILNSKDYFLRQIYEHSISESESSLSASCSDLNSWIKKNPWVKSYAVYKNLKYKYMQASWKTWPEDDALKSAEEIESLFKDKKLQKEHYFYVWEQMIADQQFSASVKAVHKCGILLKGDMPILMNEDSCDAWANPQFFNQDLRAGSPADGDNPKGQNWGFPTYNWKILKENNYSWWIDRLKCAEKYYDAYRLDHILGFFRIWAIPENDLNALNGHTEPYAFIKRTELYENGFDDDRIRWLSQGHIPTSKIEDITWNHENAVQILELFCNRIGSEELWLFKKNLKGSRQIQDTDFLDFCTPEAEIKIKEILTDYWSDRTLLEVAKNKFVPMWTYTNSTSWKSLNNSEKNQLCGLFNGLEEKNTKLWKKQAEEIFTAITQNIKMIPCGEDLGVGIDCVPKVMQKKNILGLRVLRWCRLWDKEGQPFISSDDFTPLSVTTTSVHDSSTIRQWWQDEKESVKAFIKEFGASFGLLSQLCDEQQLKLELERIASEDFSPEIAKIIMSVANHTASVWNISPLQDYLYMNKKYWLEKAEDERINIPGTVTAFNWTYRLPLSLEILNSDKQLIQSIKNL